jgi:hypothetical protein
MGVESIVHLGDRTDVLVGNALHALVENQIASVLARNTSLPLPTCFANTNAPIEIACHALEVALEVALQRRFLGLDGRH